MMRKQSGMISVVNRKLITSCSSVFTSAPTKPKTFSSHSYKIVRYSFLLGSVSLPITPRLVSRRYSKGRVLLTVCRKGYRNRGIWAARKAELEEKENVRRKVRICVTVKTFTVCREVSYRVSTWEATHCSSAKALHTRLDWWAVSVGGFIDG